MQFMSHIIPNTAQAQIESCQISRKRSIFVKVDLGILICVEVFINTQSHNCRHIFNSVD